MSKAFGVVLIIIGLAVFFWSSSLLPDFVPLYNNGVREIVSTLLVGVGVLFIMFSKSKPR